MVEDALAQEDEADEFELEQLRRIEARLGALDNQMINVRRSHREGIYSDTDFVAERQSIEEEQQDLELEAERLRRDLEPAYYEQQGHEDSLRKMAAALHELGTEYYSWDSWLMMIEELDLHLTVLPDKVLLSAANGALVGSEFTYPKVLSPELST